jgi:hypothetical protein
MTIYNQITEKEVKKFPIIAGMPFGKQDYKMKVVGHRWVEFTYDVNPKYPDDKMLIGEREIKRTFK